MPSIDHRRWSDIASESVAANISRQRLELDQVTVARLVLTRGARVAEHSHEHDQVTFVLSGCLRVKSGDTQVDVRDGELICIPARVPLEVEIVDDAVVIDLFVL